MARDLPAAADPAADIGTRVAAHRIKQGMKVSALAREAGVSPSLISQIERGQSRPSVSTLFALSEALDVPMDAFFRDGDGEQPPLRLVRDDGRHVVRRRDRASIDIEGGVRWERLTPTQLDDLEFLRFEANEGAVEHAHPQEQVMIVISGRLQVELEGEAGELGPGEGFHAPPNVPHKVTALQDTVVLSCKDVIGGIGHKMAPGETDRLQELGKA